MKKIKRILSLALIVVMVMPMMVMELPVSADVYNTNNGVIMSGSMSGNPLLVSVQTTQTQGEWNVSTYAEYNANLYAESYTSGINKFGTYFDVSSGSITGGLCDPYYNNDGDAGNGFIANCLSTLPQNYRTLISNTADKTYIDGFSIRTENSTVQAYIPTPGNLFSNGTMAVGSGYVAYTFSSNPITGQVNYNNFSVAQGKAYGPAVTGGLMSEGLVVGFANGNCFSESTKFPDSYCPASGDYSNRYNLYDYIGVYYISNNTLQKVYDWRFGATLGNIPLAIPEYYSGYDTYMDVTFRFDDNRYLEACVSYFDPATLTREEKVITTEFDITKTTLSRGKDYYVSVGTGSNIHCDATGNMYLYSPRNAAVADPATDYSYFTSPNLKILEIGTRANEQGEDYKDKSPESDYDAESNWERGGKNGTYNSSDNLKNYNGYFCINHWAKRMDDGFDESEHHLPNEDLFYEPVELDGVVYAPNPDKNGVSWLLCPYCSKTTPNVNVEDTKVYDSIDDITGTQRNTPLDGWKLEDNTHLFEIKDSSVAKVGIRGAQLRLENDLTLRVAVEKKAFDAAESQYGKYTTSKKVTKANEPYMTFKVGSGAEIKVTPITYEQDSTLDHTTFYYFDLKDIAPYQIGETITMSLYAYFKSNYTSADNKYYHMQTISYGVEDYCINMLTKMAAGTTFAANNEFRTLLVDVLNYGVAAEGYVSSYTGDKIDTAAYANWASYANTGDLSLKSYSATVKNIDAPAATMDSASLVLDNAVNIKVNFSASANVTGWKVIVTDCDGVATECAVTGSNGSYSAIFEGVWAGCMREWFEIKVVDANGVEVSNTVRYSAESYAANKINSGDAALAELCDKMMRYGDSAYNYYVAKATQTA